MEAGAATGSSRGWQLWALLPILLLVGAVSLFATAGGSIVDLVGSNPPPADELDIRRVSFEPGRIEIKVTNPQRDAITIGTVTVADAIVPYTVDGPTTLERLRSATIVVPYDWVQDEPISVGVTSSSGIQVTEEIAGRRGDARSGLAERLRLRADRIPRRRRARRARAHVASCAARRGSPLAGRLHGAHGRPA